MDERDTKIRLLVAKRDLAQAELDAALGELGVVVFRRSDGEEVPLGPDAVVITPCAGWAFMCGRFDEARTFHNQDALRVFCEEITADPRWCIPPSGRPAKPPG